MPAARPVYLLYRCYARKPAANGTPIPVMSDILRRSAWCAAALVACSGPAARARPRPAQPTGLSTSWLARYLPEVEHGELIPGADAYGIIREDLPIAPVLRCGRIIAWAFLTSNLVGTVGYSGKPIHVLTAISPDARLAGARRVGHSEPIVLVSIPESKIQTLTARHTGFDLTSANAEREPDIISGTTITVVVIDDLILRSGIRVARLLGLGGMTPEAAAGSGLGYRLAPDSGAAESWMELLGDRPIRRLYLDLEHVNSAFATSGDARAAPARTGRAGRDLHQPLCNPGHRARHRL